MWQSRQDQTRIHPSIHPFMCVIFRRFFPPTYIQSSECKHCLILLPCQHHFIYCNSQLLMGAGLESYAFNLLKSNGIIDWQWNSRDKSYFILIPNDIKFYYDLLLQLSHVNWNDTSWT
eukprot:980750_1